MLVNEIIWLNFSKKDGFKTYRFLSDATLPDNVVQFQKKHIN